MPLKSDHNAVWKENRNVVIKKQKTRQLTQQHNSEKKKVGQWKNEQRRCFLVKKKWKSDIIK